MLMAKEQVIRNKFFLPDNAWNTPMPVSTWNRFVFAACLFCVSWEAPLIAVTGETLEAFFAGEREARSTIKKPTTIPARIPMILNSNNGTSENRSPLMDLSNRQAAHVTTWPASRPMGTPFALCLIPCRITKYFTCFADAPKQRSSP